MKIDWKGVRRKYEIENEEIRKRREKRQAELRKILEESGRGSTELGRQIKRMGMSGQPRSRIFSERMKIPKGRR